MVSKLVIWFIHVSLPCKTYIHRVSLTNLRPEPRHDLKMHYQTDEPPRLSALPVTLFLGFIRIPPVTVSRREEQVQKTQDTWFTQGQIYLLVQGMSQIQKQWEDRNLEKTMRPPREACCWKRQEDCHRSLQVCNVMGGLCECRSGCVWPCVHMCGPEEDTRCLFLHSPLSSFRTRTVIGILLSIPSNTVLIGRYIHAWFVLLFIYFFYIWYYDIVTAFSLFIPPSVLSFKSMASFLMSLYTYMYVYIYIHVFLNT